MSCIENFVIFYKHVKHRIMLCDVDNVAKYLIP